MKRNVIFMFCVTAFLLLLHTSSHSAAAEQADTDLGVVSDYMLLTDDGTAGISYKWNKASEYVQMDSNHSCHFLISENHVQMNMVYARGDDVSSNTYDYLGIEIGSDVNSSNNTYLESCRIADNRILLLVKNYSERQAKLYLFTSQNDYQYIGTYSCAPMQHSVSVFEDGCILMNGDYQYVKIDLQTGKQKLLDAVTPEDWKNALPWKIEGIGYFIFDNDMINLLDEEGEIKEEAENVDDCNFSQGEEFQAAFLYRNQIAVITAGTYGTGYLTLFDEHLNRVEKRVLFRDSAFFWWSIKKVQGGYLIDCAMSSAKSGSEGTDTENGWKDAVGEIILLDEDFNFVTTAVRYGTYTNQFYLDRISFYLDSRLFFKDDIDAYGLHTLCYTKQFSMTETVSSGNHSVTLGTRELNVNEYDTYQLEIKSEQVFVNQAITWTSGDSSVASVGAGGMITANCPGSTVITMKCGEYTDSCVVTVNETEKERIEYPLYHYQQELTAYLEGDTLTIEISDLYKGALVAMPDFNNLPIWYDDRDKIKHVVIGEGITAIGKYAFLDCENLRSVTMPDSLQFIELYAFDNSGITELDIPAGVTYIGTELNNCPKLKTLNIDPENKSYVFEDGILYNYSKTRLIGCCVQTKGCIMIPDTVKTVQKNAFCGCKMITGVQISKNMSTIPSFEGCRQLKELFVPESVTQIPISVIYYSCLSDIVIQGMDTKITESGFSYTSGENFDGITDCIIYAYPGSCAESFMTTDYLNGSYQEMEKEQGISLQYISLNANQTNLQQLQLHPDSSYELLTEDDMQYLKGIQEKTTLEELLGNLNNPSSLISVYDETGNKIRDGKQMIGTGYYVKTFSDTAVIVIKGDVDGNGVINVLDMEQIQKKVLGIAVLDKIREMAAHITAQDKISVLDMEAVQKHILKIQNIG